MDLAFIRQVLADCIPRAAVIRCSLLWISSTNQETPQCYCHIYINEVVNGLCLLQSKEEVRNDHYVLLSHKAYMRKFCAVYHLTPTPICGLPFSVMKTNVLPSAITFPICPSLVVKVPSAATEYVPDFEAVDKVPSVFLALV